MAKTAPPTIEEQLKRLEEISALLDRGEISLDEQLKIYEEGMKIADVCKAYLEKAELTVRRLSGEE